MDTPNLNADDAEALSIKKALLETLKEKNAIVKLSRDLSEQFEVDNSKLYSSLKGGVHPEDLVHIVIDKLNWPKSEIKDGEEKFLWLSHRAKILPAINNLAHKGDIIAPDYTVHGVYTKTGSAWNPTACLITNAGLEALKNIEKQSPAEDRSR